MAWLFQRAAAQNAATMNTPVGLDYMNQFVKRRKTPNQHAMKFPVPLDYMVEYIAARKTPTWIPAVEKWIDSLGDDDKKFEEKGDDFDKFKTSEALKWYASLPRRAPASSTAWPCGNIDSPPSNFSTLVRPSPASLRATQNEHNIDQSSSLDILLDLVPGCHCSENNKLCGSSCIDLLRSPTEIAKCRDDQERQNTIEEMSKNWSSSKDWSSESSLFGEDTLGACLPSSSMTVEDMNRMPSANCISTASQETVCFGKGKGKERDTLAATPASPASPASPAPILRKTHGKFVLRTRK